MSLVSKQFVGGYDLSYRYRRHTALRMFSRHPKTLTGLPFHMKYVLGIQAIKYLCTAQSLRGGLGDIQAQGTDLRDLYHKPFSLSMACFNL